MFNISEILNGIAITVTSTIIIASLSLLLKKLKNNTFRHSFFKRFIFYDSILGLILFTYNLFNFHDYPKKISILGLILSIFNIVYVFESIIKECQNRNNSNNNWY